MKINLVEIDHKILHFIKRVSMPFSRFAIFAVFFWFGALKIFGLSPANPLVMELQERTIPFLTFSQFIVIFAIFEMLIGLVFLIKGHERLAIALLLIHMVTTFMPLILLPSITWQGFFVPTLEGQYIIKNLVIIATAIGIAAHAHLHRMHNIEILVKKTD